VRLASKAVQIRIEGTDLPGRSCGPSPERRGGYGNVHVGVQRRNDPRRWLDLQPGDAESAIWMFEGVATQGPDGIDLGGPYIQGGPRQRFIYLSWGTLANSEFTMFRRAKLRIADIDLTTLHAAVRSGLLVARLGLTDPKGNPTCATVSPADVQWSAAE
jgi:hypothetical protein